MRTNGTMVYPEFLPSCLQFTDLFLQFRIITCNIPFILTKRIILTSKMKGETMLTYVSEGEN